MANKATVSITRSREEPDLKRPMVPLRFLSEPADVGTTQGSPQSHRGAGGRLWNPWGRVSSPRPTLTHAGALGLCLLICEVGMGRPPPRGSGEGWMRCLTCAACRRGSINGRRSRFYAEKSRRDEVT